MNQVSDVGATDITNMTGASNDFNMNIQDQLGVPPAPPIPDFLTNESSNTLPGVDPNVMADLTNTGPTPIVGSVDNTQSDNILADQIMTTETQNAEIGTTNNESGIRAEGQVQNGENSGVASETTNVGAGGADPAVASDGGKLEEVKKQMLQDLYPLMDKIKMQPEQKFKVYKQMIEATGSKDMISSAYEAAKGIGDEVGRAEALLFLVEKADS